MIKPKTDEIHKWKCFMCRKNCSDLKELCVMCNNCNIEACDKCTYKGIECGKYWIEIDMDTDYCVHCWEWRGCKVRYVT